MTKETPAHYAEGLALDVLDLMETMGGGLRKSFCFGNAMKYVARAGLKPGDTALRDLKEAKRYLSEAGYSHAFAWTITDNMDLRLLKGEILKYLMIGWNTDKYDPVSKAAGAIAGWIKYEEKKEQEVVK